MTNQNFRDTKILKSRCLSELKLKIDTPSFTKDGVLLKFINFKKKNFWF